MKSLILACLTLSVFCLACINEPSGWEDSAKAEKVRVGDSLPSFRVQTVSGDSVWSDHLRGKPSVVVFFHTRCGDCDRALPVVQRLYDEYRWQVDFLCLGRNQSLPEATAYWQQVGLTLPRATEEGSAVYELFARGIIPRVYVSDSTGTVRAVFIEQVEEAPLRAALQHLVHGSQSAETP